MQPIESTRSTLDGQNRKAFRLTSLLLVLTIFLLFSPSPVRARWSLTPRLYVAELYDDNIFLLTEQNEQDDFITTIGAGINFAYETPTETISLDYEFRRLFYADFSELDYSDHRVRADARKDFGPWFSAGIRDIFISSEDPVELTGDPTFERPSIRSGMRNRYIRNIVEPNVTFRFGENRSIRLGYRNQILRNDDDDIADLDENAGNVLLTFRIDIHNGIEVFYEHVKQDYGAMTPSDPIRDFHGDEIRTRYTYYFTPKTSAFVEYRYHQKDFDRESIGFFDYKIHDGHLGFTHRLLENTVFSASAGAAFRDADGQDDTTLFAGQLNLSTKYKRLDAEIYAETGFGEDYYSAENLGIHESWRVGFNGRYQLLQRLWADGYFYVEEDRFTDLDRTDRYWNARARLSYQLLKWLFLSFDYEYNERDSNIPLERYVDNRYFGRVTIQYDIAEYFQ